MRLIQEIADSKEIKTKIVEETDSLGQPIKSAYIMGPFIVSETKNKNGRIYKREVVLREVELFKKEKILNNRAGGELNHPDSPIVNLDRISHYITDLQEENNIWYGKAKLASTPMGLLAQSLLRDGYQLGVSTRGLGEVMQDGVVSNDFKLITIDLVSDPSAHSAFVDAIYENKNFILKNGQYFEEPIKNLTKKLETLPKNSNKYLTETIVSFLKSLK